MNSSLFLESLLNAQLVSLMSPATFFAMRAFGSDELVQAALISGLGGTAGMMVNWGLGRLLLLGRQRGTFSLSDEIYAKARRLAHYGLPLLAFNWLVFGGFLVLAAAFLQLPKKIALPLIAAGQFGYYQYFVLIP